MNNIQTDAVRGAKLKKKVSFFKIHRDGTYTQIWNV